MKTKNSLLTKLLVIVSAVCILCASVLFTVTNNSAKSSVASADGTEQTWVFNENIPRSAFENLSSSYFEDKSFAFTTNGTNYTYMKVNNYTGIYYGGSSNVVYEAWGTGWSNDAYRTITFTTEPTNAGLLNFIKANATQLLITDEPTKDNDYTVSVGGGASSQWCFAKKLNDYTKTDYVTGGNAPKTGDYAFEAGTYDSTNNSLAVDDYHTYAGYNVYRASIYLYNYAIEDAVYLAFKADNDVSFNSTAYYYEGGSADPFKVGDYYYTRLNTGGETVYSAVIFTDSETTVTDLRVVKSVGDAGTQLSTTATLQNEDYYCLVSNGSNYAISNSVTPKAISFNGNGGTGTAPNTIYQLEDRDIITFPTNTFARNGYAFLGWNNDKDATTALSSYKVGSSDATLYAIWEQVITEQPSKANNYTVTVDNEFSSSTLKWKKATPLSAYSEFDNSTQKGEYQIMENFGSYDSANNVLSGTDTGIEYSLQIILFNDIVKTNNYFRFKCNLEYSGSRVGISDLYGNGFWTNDDVNIVKNGGYYYATFQVHENTPISTDLVFYSAVSFEFTDVEIIESVNDGEKLSSTATVDEDSNYFCMVYDEDSILTVSNSTSPIAVAFDGNGGTGTAPETIYLLDGKSVTLPTNTFTKNGYVFAGWNTDKNATTKLDSYSVDSADATNNTITLYAVWKNIIATQPSKDKDNNYTVVVDSLVTDATYQWVQSNPLNEYTAYDKTTNPTGDYYFVGTYEGSYNNENNTLYGGEYSNVYYLVLKCHNSLSYENLYLKFKSTIDLSSSDNVNYVLSDTANYFAVGDYWYVKIQEGTDYNTGEDCYQFGFQSKQNFSFTDVSVLRVIGTEAQLPTDVTLKNADYFCIVNTGSNYAVSNSFSPVAVAFDGNNATSGTAPTTIYQLEGRSVTLPANPFTRTDYEFVGWNTDSSATTALSSYTAGSSDVTLYAIWELLEFDITYNLDNGTNNVNNPAKYKKTDDTITLGDPTKTGYRFMGWYSSNSFVEANKVTEITSGSTGAKTLYAYFEKEYSVVFDLNNGTGTTPTTITNKITGEAITLPAQGDITRKGYIFVGWNVDDEATIKLSSYSINSSDANDSTITVYAIWRAKLYTVEFNKNGGAGTASSSLTNKIQGEAITLPTSVSFTKKGHSFIGWNLTKSATSKLDSYSIDCDDATNTTITLYAIWEQNEYSVVFDINGGEGTVPSAIENKVNGDAITLPTSVNLTKTHYLFAGWALENDATTALDSYTLDCNNATGLTVTLYAVWQEDSYSNNITVSVSDIAVWLQKSDVTVSVTSDNNLSVHDFAMYYNPSYSNLVKKTEFDVAGSYLLVAIIKNSDANKFFALNDDSYIGTVTSGANSISYAIPCVDYEFEDGIFSYTYADDNIDNTYLAVGISVSVSSTGVVYNANTTDEVTNLPAKDLAMEGETVTVSTTVPQRIGYRFVGWTDQPDGDEVVYQHGAQITMGKINVHLYAMWKVQNYTVVFDANGGEGTVPKQITGLSNGDEVTLPANTLTKENCKFLGWNTDKDALSYLTSYSLDATEAENFIVTLYAVWYDNDRDNTNITLYTGGAKIYSSNWRAIEVGSTYRSIGSASAVPQLTMNGTSENITFDGWYSDQSFTTPVSSFEKGGIYYAKWNRSATSYSGQSMSYNFNASMFDIKGTNSLKTTFGNGGYKTNIIFSGSSQSKRISLSTSSNNDMYYNVGNGIYVAIVPFITGNYVSIAYYIQNRGTTKLSNFAIGSCADVQIGNNDRAPLTRKSDSTGTYVEMTDGTNTLRLYYAGNNYVTDVSTFWVGAYSGHTNNIFNNNNANANGYDSTLAFSWQGIEIEPGETVVKSVMIGAGSASSMALNPFISYIDDEFSINNSSYEFVAGNNGIDIAVEYPTLQKGWYFGGWYLNQNFTGTAYYGGEIINNVKTTTRFYAKWTEVESAIDVSINYTGSGPVSALNVSLNNGEIPLTYNSDTGKFTGSATNGDYSIYIGDICTSKTFTVNNIGDVVTGEPVSIAFAWTEVGVNVNKVSEVETLSSNNYTDANYVIVAPEALETRSYASFTYTFVGWRFDYDDTLYTAGQSTGVTVDSVIHNAEFDFDNNCQKNVTFTAVYSVDYLYGIHLKGEIDESCLDSDGHCQFHDTDLNSKTVTINYTVTVNDGVNSIVLIPEFDSNIFELTNVTVNNSTSLGSATITNDYTASGHPTVKILLESNNRYNTVGDMFISVTYKMINAVGGKYTFGFVTNYQTSSEDDIDNTNRSHAYFWDGDNKKEQTEVKVFVNVDDVNVYITRLSGVISIGNQTFTYNKQHLTTTHYYTLATSYFDYVTYYEYVSGSYNVVNITSAEFNNGTYYTINTPNNVLFSHNGYGVNAESGAKASIYTVRWYVLEGTNYVEIDEAPINVGTYYVQISATENLYYLETVSEKATITIIPEQIIIEVADNHSTYDEELADVSNSGTVISGIIYEGDNLGISYSVVGVTSQSVVGVYNGAIVGSWNNNPNYNVMFTNGSYTMLAAVNNFVISLNTTNRDYNGSQITIGTASNKADYFASSRYASSEITYEFYTYVDSEYVLLNCAPTDAGSYYIKATTKEDKDRYTSVSVMELITINKLLVNIDSLTASSKVYKHAKHTWETTDISGVSSTAQYMILSIDEVSGDYINAGDYQVRVNMVLKDPVNYAFVNDISYVDVDCKITKFAVSIMPIAQSEVFNTSNHNPANSYEFIVNGGEVPAFVSADTSLTVTVIKKVSEDWISAGNYTTSISYTDANNNYAVTIIDGVFTITKAIVNIPTIDDFTYNGEAQAPTVSLDDVYTITVTPQVDVGNYTATYSLKQQNNYKWAEDTSYVLVSESADVLVKWKIDRAYISISVDDKTSVYGDDIVPLTYQITYGQVYGDDDLHIVLNTLATKTSDAGEYEITIEGMDNDNYDVMDYSEGTYTITRIEVTSNEITAKNIIGLAIKGFIKEYNGSGQSWDTDEFTISTLTNQVVGDSVVEITSANTISDQDYTNANGKIVDNVWTYYQDNSQNIVKKYSVDVAIDNINYVFYNNVTTLTDIEVEVFIKQAVNSWIESPSVQAISVSDITKLSQAKFGDDSATKNFVDYFTYDGSVYTQFVGEMSADAFYYAKFSVEGTDNYTGLLEYIKFKPDNYYVDGSILVYFAQRVASINEEITYNGKINYFTKDLQGLNAYSEDTVCTGYNYTVTSQVNAWKDVGTYTLTFNLLTNWLWYDGTNNIITYTLKINRAPLTIVANDESVTYLDNAPTYTAIVNGFVENESIGEFGLNISNFISCEYTNTSKVKDGGYTIVVADNEYNEISTSLYNYNVIFTNATLTVNKKSISGFGLGYYATTYDGEKHTVNYWSNYTNAFNATYFMDGEEVSELSATDVKRVGGLVSAYNISVTLSLTDENDANGNKYSENYVLEETTLENELRIYPKDIKITALPKTSIYSEAIENLEYNISYFSSSYTFLSRDNMIVNLFTYLGSEAVTLTNESNAGSYTIKALATGSGIGNYTIDYVDDIYEITKAQNLWTIELNATNRVYNGIQIVKGTDYNSVAKFGDSTTVYTFYANNDTSVVSTPVEAGTYYIHATVPETNNYYGLNASVPITISKANLSVSMNSSDVTYDAENHYVSIIPASGINVTYTIDGVAGNGAIDVKRGTGDVVEAYTVVATITLKTTNDIYGYAYSNNYQLIGLEEGNILTRTLTINPKAITVTAENKSVQYGENPLTLTAVTSEDFYARDNVSISCALANDVVLSNQLAVETYTIIPVATNVSNYTVTYTNGNYEVTKANAEVTISADDTYYNRSINYTVVSNVNTLSIDSYTIEYYSGDTKLNEAPVNAGTYKIKAVVADTNNYNGANNEATFEIKKISLKQTTLSYDKDVVDFTVVTYDAGATGVAEKPIRTDTILKYYVEDVENTTMSYTATETKTYTIKVVAYYSANPTVVNENYIESTITTAQVYKVQFAEGTHEKNTGFGVIGDAYNNQLRFSGETADVPAEIPTIEGYTFIQWNNGSSLYDFATPVIADTIIIAVWSIKSYTVYWMNANNEIYHELYEYKSIPAYNEQYGTPLKDSSAEYNYMFIGWNNNSEALEILASMPIVTEDAHYYAIFTAEGRAYTISYYVSENGADYKLYKVVDDVKYDSIIYIEQLTAVAWFNTETWYTDELRANLAPTSMVAYDLKLYGAYIFDIGNGDVNGDRSVDVDDITLYRQWIVGNYPIIVVEKGTEWELVHQADFDAVNNTYFLKTVADVNAIIENLDKLDVRDVSTIRMSIVKGFDWDIVTQYHVTGEEVVKRFTPVVTAPTAISNLMANGNAQALVNAGSTTGGTLYYALGTEDEVTGEYSTSIPTATEIGTYYVWYKVVGDAVYFSVDADKVSVTISEFVKTTPTVTAPTAISNLTEDGNAQALVNAGSTTGGTLYYALGTEDEVTGEYSTSIPTATEAGSYYVWYKVVGDAEYSDVSAKKVYAQLNSTSKTAPLVIAPTAISDLVADGTPQALVNAGEVYGGTMYYALGTSNEATGEYSTEIPTATDADTYYVWYKVVGDAFHVDVDADYLSVQISTYSPTVTS